MLIKLIVDARINYKTYSEFNLKINEVFLDEECNSLCFSNLSLHLDEKNFCDFKNFISNSSTYSIRIISKNGLEYRFYRD